MRIIKVKDKSKKTTTFLVGMILGIIIAATSASAAILYQSSQVSYSNAGSGLSSTNVQAAIDELSDRTSNWVNPMDMGTPTNYLNSGTTKPTTSSPTTPPSGVNVYLALYSDKQIGVCIKNGGDQYCFRTGNWIAEIKHAQSLLSCTKKNNSSFIWYECSKDNVYCEIDPEYIECDDLATDKFCIWYNNNTGGCYDN